MANLAASVGGMLGAGVRGIMDMADGLMHIGEADPMELLRDDRDDHITDEGGEGLSNGGAQGTEQEAATPITARTLPRRTPSHSDTASHSSSLSVPSSNVSAMSTSISNLSLRQSALIQTTDVPSGWIHLQNTYIDVAGDRTVRSFGVRNLVDEEIEVEVASDLGDQVVFWLGEDEKDLSSAASYSSASSASTSTGTPSLILSISSQSSVVVYLAFIPSRHTSASPPIPQSPMLSDGGFTPRVLPTQRSMAVSSMPLDSASAASGPSANSVLSSGGDVDSVSAGSSQSVAGSFKAPSSVGAGSRRTEPNYRAFSLHGCITLRASVSTASTPRTDSTASALSAASGAMQMLNLPFFATVCRSHFTAALLDPSTGLASNSHQGSGQMVIDFGSECVVGQEYHRDILLVNRSEIELVWMTAVVNSRYKNQAWFSLRDLDSENVFGVDTSSQPVPLPSLSSRHLRLTLRIREPVIDFAFDFVISNVNQSGNLVTCRAIGSGQSSASDNVLRLLSGNNLDFGQVVDGMWAKTLITCKNAGDKPMEVKFSASQGEEVCFRLAGVAGDDMDEDILLDSRAKRVAAATVRESTMGSSMPGAGQGVHDTHALLVAPPRSSARSMERERGRMTSSPLRSRPTSPNGSSRFGASTYGSESQGDHHAARNYETDSQGSSYAYDGMHTSGPRWRDPSLPPSRPLSRVASRSSSYRYAHTDATESDEDESEAPFLGGSETVPPPSQPGASNSGFSSSYAPSVGASIGGAASVTSNSMAPPPPPSNASSTGSASEVMYDRTIPNQIEELAMRPGTEYRVWVLYRPRRDTLNTPIVAGQLRTNTFKVFLDSSASRTAGNAASVGKGKEGGGRRTIHCSAESCTSLIRVSTTLPVAPGALGAMPAAVPAPGQGSSQSGLTELDDMGNPIETVQNASSSTTPRIDFGEVTVGASKSATIRIENLSHLSAKVEIAAISKVLSTNRNVIVIPPRESVEEKVEFFPRRINERYEKQVFVRNLLNRENDQLIDIRSRNVDVNNVTLHSHLYRILTPNGANFLDFGSVVINSPTVRTVQIENLTLAPLILSLLASSTEDVEVYVKLAEAEAVKSRLQDAQTPGTAKPAAYADEHDVLERITSPSNGNGDLKERFMETLRELEAAGPAPADKGKGVKGGKAVKAKFVPDGAPHVAGKANTHTHAHGDAHRKGHGKVTDHSHRPQASKAVEAEGAKTSVGALVAAALRKGGRGRPVQLYGNAVVFKDRSLLDHHEHLDLAAGPPIAAHRVSPRSKKSALLDSIVLEDKSQLSGQHPKVLKLDFAAGAKANGAVGKGKRKKDKDSSKKPGKVREGEEVEVRQGTSNDKSGNGEENGSEAEAMTESMVLTPKPKARTTAPSRAPLPTLANIVSSLAPAVAGPNGTGLRTPPTPDGGKSPALTGKRRESGLLKQEMFAAADVSKMSVDELLVALEQHDARRPTFARTPSAAQPLSAGLPGGGAPVGSGLMSMTGSGAAGSATLAESLTLEEEEQFVRRHIALRKELSNLISSGKLVPARQLTIPPKSTRQMIVVLTPNGSIRPHVSTRPKRADSRLFINLLDFDRSYLSASTVNVDLNDLPVRELIMRSACVRSTLEVQQTSINFGNCEKGEVRSKTIVIQNKADSIGLFRLRTSGSIASGDLKLGLGRYGVISAFGRKEFTNFSFTPSLFGKYEETIVVENVLDSYQDQTVYVKANVRKQPAFALDPLNVDFGQVALAPAPTNPSASPADASVGDGGKDERAEDGESQNLQVVDTYDLIPPSPASVVLTNVSKSERTFVITVELEKIPEVPDTEGSGESSVIVPFAEVHLSRDESGSGQALSKAEEEEVEGMMQKLKIARRKGKADKVEKYEARLTELGVELPKVGEGAEGDEKEKGEEAEVKEQAGMDVKEEKKDKGQSKNKESTVSKGDDNPPAADTRAPQADSTPQPSSADSQATLKSAPSAIPSALSPSARPGPTPLATLNPCVTSLTVTLPASQKTKILIELRQTTDKPRSVAQAASSKTRTMKASIKVHDRKNTDDTICVGVVASLAGRVEEVKSGDQDGKKRRSGKLVNVEREEGTKGKKGDEGEVSDPLHLALMRHCLDLTYKCEVSPTAFCVGSTLFLPAASAYYPALNAHFPAYTLPAADGESAREDEKSSIGPIGLILGDGYSRQIPGNTHAEANALTNFRACYAHIVNASSTSESNTASATATASTAPPITDQATTATHSLPPIEQVLKDVTCYATMEPCSIRTSGGPSCALELVRAGVKTVYLGVEEPPDFVKCEGVKILEEGGVKVWNLKGLEEECLKAARRGRD